MSACLLMSTIGPMLMCQTLFLKEIGYNVCCNGIVFSTFLLTLNVASFAARSYVELEESIKA